MSKSSERDKSWEKMGLFGCSMRRILLLGVVFFALIVSIPQAHAASVWVTDTEDNPKDKFLVGEDVKVHAFFSLTPYDIDVWTSTNDGGSWTYVKTITSPTAGYEGIHGDLSEAPPGRLYQLRIESECLYDYAISTHLVIPEFLFGSISAVLASFAGLGIVAKRRSRK